MELLRKAVGAKDGDCVIMVADSKEKAQGAMGAVITRAKEALEFIPEETRRALPDGNSAYMRPLPGAARMYPETDVPPVVITEERIRSIKLPELIGERKARYIKQFGLNEEIANQIARSANFIIFDDIMSKVPKANPNSVVRVLETILYELQKEGVVVNEITEDHLIQLFRLQSEGKIPNEAISNILKTIAGKPEVDVEKAALSLGIGGVEKGELETAVDMLVEEKMDFIKGKGLNAVGPLMGIVMKEFRGKVSGEEVSRMLKEKIGKTIDFYSNHDIIEFIKNRKDYSNKENLNQAEALKIFSTQEQQTWLVSTNERLYIIVDEKSKPLDIRREMDKGELFTNNKLSIQIEPFIEDNKNFIHIGSFQHWHYSKKLILRKQILKMR